MNAEKTLGYGYIDAEKSENTVIITVKIKDNVVLISYKASGGNHTSNGKSLSKFKKTPLKDNSEFMRLYRIWERCSEKSLSEISDVDKFNLKKILN